MLACSLRNNFFSVLLDLVLEGGVLLREPLDLSVELVELAVEQDDEAMEAYLEKLREQRRDAEKHDLQVTSALGAPNGLAAGAAMLISLFFSMNLLLFVLNLIPLPPLDGRGRGPTALPLEDAEPPPSTPPPHYPPHHPYLAYLYRNVCEDC